MAYTHPQHAAWQIIAAAKAKAAEISRDPFAIEDGYRVCSALVLRMALDTASHNHPTYHQQGVWLRSLLQSLETPPGGGNDPIRQQLDNLIEQMEQLRASLTED